VLNFRVIAAVGGTTASTVTYLTPDVAVVAGAVLLAEDLTWNQPVGAAVVLFGAALAQGPLRRTTRSPATSPEPTGHRPS